MFIYIFFSFWRNSGARADDYSQDGRWTLDRCVFQLFFSTSYLAVVLHCFHVQTEWKLDLRIYQEIFFIFGPLTCIGLCLQLSSVISDVTLNERMEKLHQHLFLMCPLHLEAQVKVKQLPCLALLRLLQTKKLMVLMNLTHVVQFQVGKVLYICFPWTLY